MEHRHPYTARGVLTALGKSALYVLFFLGVQLLTGAIYAAIAIAGSALRPGGFADARLVAGTEEAPMLPESAVQSGPEGNFVLIVDNKNQIQRRVVKVGTVTDDGVSIASGLNGTERIVVLAGAFLNPGDKVKPVVQKSSQ